MAMVVFILSNRLSLSNRFLPSNRLLLSNRFLPSNRCLPSNRFFPSKALLLSSAMRKSSHGMMGPNLFPFTVAQSSSHKLLFEFYSTAQESAVVLGSN